MKNILVFIVLLLYLSSCQDPNDSRIKQFEAQMGLQKTEALTSSVALFELALMKRYGGVSLEEAYSEYLRELLSGKFIILKDIDQVKIDALRTLLETSDLKKDIWEIVDSVKLEKNGLEAYYTYDNIVMKNSLLPIKSFAQFIQADSFVSYFQDYLTKGEVEDFYKSVDTFIIKENRVQLYKLEDSLVFISELPIPSQYLSYNKDAVIEYLNENPSFNMKGDFIKSLDLIQASDSMVIEYLSAKKAASNIPMSVVIDGLLKEEVDYNDYFVKRIIVVELFLRTLN